MGAATAEDCQGACGHLAGLYARAIAATYAGENTAVASGDGPGLSALEQDFASDCLSRCEAISTREHAACLAQVPSLDEVRACE